MEEVKKPYDFFESTSLDLIIAALNHVSTRNRVPKVVSTVRTLRNGRSKCSMTGLRITLERTGDNQALAEKRTAVYFMRRLLRLTSNGETAPEGLQDGYYDILVDHCKRKGKTVERKEIKNIGRDYWLQVIEIDRKIRVSYEGHYKPRLLNYCSFVGMVRMMYEDEIAFQRDVEKRMGVNVDIEQGRRELIRRGLCSRVCHQYVSRRCCRYFTVVIIAILCWIWIIFRPFFENL